MSRNHTHPHSRQCKHACTRPGRALAKHGQYYEFLKKKGKKTEIGKIIIPNKTSYQNIKIWQINWKSLWETLFSNGWIKIVFLKTWPKKKKKKMTNKKKEKKKKQEFFQFRIPNLFYALNIELPPLDCIPVASIFCAHSF